MPPQQGITQDLGCRHLAKAGLDSAKIGHCLPSALALACQRPRHAGAHLAEKAGITAHEALRRRGCLLGVVLIGKHLQHGWHQVKDTSLLGSCHTCRATIEMVTVLSGDSIEGQATWVFAPISGRCLGFLCHEPMC